MANASLIPDHSYRGARAMILLHEDHMRECLAVWREAKAASLSLPETDDPDYASLQHLLVHVLACGRGYMVWICEQLGLPDPQIPTAPTPDDVEQRADQWLDDLLARWRTPLAEVEGQRFNEVHASRWGVTYCIDAMLEHAVMHPIRHTFQLRELLADR